MFNGKQEGSDTCQNASLPQMIQNPTPSSSNCLQSQPNLYGKTIRDSNWKLDDYIQAISDENNSCLKRNQNESLVDKTCVYMSMNY